MDHFLNFKEYGDFALAREFLYRDPTKGMFNHVPNRLEKLGGRLIAPLFTPADKVLRNIRNPLLIAALTISGIFFTTLLFYPSVFVLLTSCVLAIKITAFTLLQTTILGLCLRTLGRLSPSNELLKAWDNKELVPVPIGAEFY